MSKLVLIDGNAIMHRAFHALPPLTTKYGEPINAVYGLISMLLRVIEDLKPTHIAVCFDRPEPTFRKELLIEYQAHRPEMDTSLSPQFGKAYQVLEAFGIPIYSKAGFEADDVIGTLAQEATENQKIQETVIVTGDRDILQLVNAKVGVYMPVQGFAKGKLFDKEAVKERMGVNPDQIVDYKALVGDSSDNYKGVPGVGPKTAENLLLKYGNLENIYKHINDLPESVSKKLIDNKDSAYLSQKLARIVTNVDFEYNLDDSAKWQVDSPKALNLFEDFGFKTLTNRVKEVGKNLVSENQTSLF